MAFRFVAMGTSLGGFLALKEVLQALPADFSVPIGVVQHRSYEDMEAFAPLLAQYSRLQVTEVDDKEPIQEGNIYVCPPNYHLLVDGNCFSLSTDAPVLHARPSIDVFFQSAAESFGDGVIGVLLTGMSRDGTAGLKRIRECGGYAVVQDPFQAVGDIMPKTAIASGAVDKVLPLEGIAAFLTALCAGQRAEI
jgi:two-component system chemotaxis response regulator CheB